MERAWLRISLICLVGLTASSFAQTTQPEANTDVSLAKQTFDDGQGDWIVSTGTKTRDASATASPVEEPGANGKALLLSYAFTGTGNTAGGLRELYSLTFMRKIVPEADRPVIVRLRVKGSQAGRSIRVNYKDTSEESFSSPSAKLTGDWQVLEFDLSKPAKHWGGDDKGVVDWPLRFITISAVNWGGKSKEPPEKLWLDEVEVVQYGGKK